MILLWRSTFTMFRAEVRPHNYCNIAICFQREWLFRFHTSEKFCFLSYDRTLRCSTNVTGLSRDESRTFTGSHRQFIKSRNLRHNDGQLLNVRSKSTQIIVIILCKTIFLTGFVFSDTQHAYIAWCGHIFR